MNSFERFDFILRPELMVCSEVRGGGRRERGPRRKRRAGREGGGVLRIFRSPM